MQLIMSKVLSVFSLLSSIFSSKSKLQFKNYKIHTIKRGVFLKNHLKKNIYVRISNLALATSNFVTFSSDTIRSQNNAIRFRAMDLTNKFYCWFSNVFKVQPMIYFLRKQKLFNKGRYSRNRQTYRTGAIWSLWVNILAVTGFYYWFYRFSMNFGYVWPFLSLFVLSFIVPRAIKYNYFIVTNLVQSFIKLFVWFYLLILSFFNSFLTTTTKLSADNKISSLSQPLFFNSLLNSSLNFLHLALISFYFVCDRFDLYLKTYSHWNYFLPIGWIHRHHRSFFFARVYHIIFNQKLNS